MSKRKEEDDTILAGSETSYEQINRLTCGKWSVP